MAAPSQPSPWARFQASRELDYERWHDGVPYDLDALREMSEPQLQRIERELSQLERPDWRDIDALDVLGTPGALAALERYTSTASPAVRVRAARILARRGRPEFLERTIVAALAACLEYDTFTEILEAAQALPTARVKSALVAAALRGPRVLRVHAAAMLLFLAGGSKEPFDWEHRQLFLQFNVDDPKARMAAFGALQMAIAQASAPRTAADAAPTTPPAQTSPARTPRSAPQSPRPPRSPAKPNKASRGQSGQ